MTYLALYREWRPRTFGEVVGQDHVVRTLVNALKNERLSHAYLFCGPRGTGKTSVAKILARAVNCLHPGGGEPCGQCDNCREIESGTSMDVTEIDAASNRGIDEVRDLREKVRFAPSAGKIRVFIIDEVHMLTNEAFNALLKTLEEPPPHVMFILATTEPHRVPLTILSRCQRFDFHRIGDLEMADRLKKVAEKSGIGIDQPAVELIVRAAEGGMRDGLGILDQAAAYSGSRIGVDEIHGILGTVREDLLGRVARGLMGGRAGEVLGLVDEVAGQGKDLRIFLKELNAYLRRMLLELTGAGEAGGEVIDRLSLAIHRLVGAEQEMRWSTQPRVLLEVALVRAARALGASGGSGAWEDRIGELTARVRDLEALVAGLAGEARESAAGAVPLPARVQSQTPVSAPAADVPRGISPPGGGKDIIKDTGRGSEKGAGEKKNPAEYADHSAGARAGILREQPAVAKAVAAASAPPSLLLAKVNARWSDVLEVAGKVCPHIASHLVQGKSWPLEVEGNTLVIAFPKSEFYAQVALNILDSEANRRDLSDLIKSVCQADLRLRLAVSDRKPPGKAARQKKTVRPDDVDSLFGKDEEAPGEDASGIDSWEED